VALYRNVIKSVQKPGKLPFFDINAFLMKLSMFKYAHKHQVDSANQDKVHHACVCGNICEDENGIEQD
jgi:hypothetical protein